MQTFSNPAGRNEKVAANSGKGVMPGSVSVPFPQKGSSPAPSGAGRVKAPAGFNGGIIAGKI
jgi:hypothetical protein